MKTNRVPIRLEFSPHFSTGMSRHGIEERKSSQFGQTRPMQGRQLLVLVTLIPVYVRGGQDFSSWIGDIIKEKGVNQYETDYRWSEISAKPSESCRV